MTGLSNIDRTDLELLHVIRKVGGSRGFASGADIATELGIIADGRRTGAGRVSSRLSWMQRYGMLYKSANDKNGALWGISVAGERLMEGRLNQAVSDAIERDNPGAQLLMMRRLTQRAVVSGDAATSAALRREYQHNAAQRPR